MEDFDDVLAALIAIKNNEHDLFVDQCRVAQNANLPAPPLPETSIDKLQKIWNTVFPQRKLKVQDAKFLAVLVQDGVEKEYSATEMSDGERAVLYLAAQVLCVPPNKTLIIDEPEIHLHRSLMNKLWTTLESFRPDCLFIYITHDTQFAAMHSHAEKVWIRGYDGENWDFERLEKNNLPEDLLLDILGSRKPVLFIEGNIDSYDMKLYSVLYPNYYVIPCGSCTQVIARTKVFNANTSLHHYSVYGIIDRDFRAEEELERYKKHNIFTVNVAEIENMFLVEGLIRIVAKHMGKDPDSVFSQVEKNIVEQRFKIQLQHQVCQSVVAQMKYRLACLDIPKTNDVDAKKTMETFLQQNNYDQIANEQLTLFQAAISGGYSQVIKVFNEKNIVSSIGHFFGLNNREYCSLVLSLLNEPNKKNEIVQALIPYLPIEIER